MGLYDDSVYLCNDRLMMASNAASYGVIYLGPSHLADFSRGDVSIDSISRRTAPPRAI
jgi:hypothetical protein